MNKRMFENFKAKQMLLECDKEIILREISDMERYNKLLTYGVSEEVKKLSEEFISNIKKSMERIVVEQKQVIAAINSIENLDWKILLKLKYIDGLPMSEIEENMNISHRTAYRYLNAAFEALGII